MYAPTRRSPIAVAARRSLTRLAVVTAAATGAFTLASCGADYLDEAEVFRHLEASSTYQTPNDAVLAVNAAYTPLQYQGGYRRYPYLLDFLSGDLNITSGGRQLTAYPGFRFNAASPHIVPATWETMFTGIARANVVLERVPDIQFPDETLRERILGEAHFLRGLYYFELARHYGGVPIYRRSFTGDLDDELFQPARASVAEVYDFVEEDFRMARERLPESYDAEDKGRATAGAALAMLGMTHLYQEEYQQAADALRPLVDGEVGDYALVDFEANFTADNENNAESVFEIQFATGVGRGFSDGDGASTAESNWMATALNPGRVRAFANGLPSVEVDDFFRRFPEDSLRRLFTIARPGDTWGTWAPIAEDPIAANQWRDRTGDVAGAPFLGVRKGTEGPSPVGFVQSPINFRLLRFAEVLLLFAEAENEANGGPTDAAYAAINRVRERAGVDPLPEGLDQDEFFERIAIERRLELTFEFKRFFDIVRWSRRDGDVPDFAQTSAMPGFVEGRNEVFPIPEGELISNPNLEQNPGY